MATGDRPDFGETFDFAEVFRGEINSINKRRRKNGRDPIALEREPFETSDGTEPLRPKEDANVLGIALSGGGVRSAAFCLGALQGLREADVLSKADYLSTVSGGGYIGASVSAGMTDDGGHFPFHSELSEDESPSLQHVRDYSNYLFPHGPADFLYNASIYLRGLVANAILVLLFLLTFAAITIVSKPKIGIGSEPNLLGVRIPDVFGFNHFVVTSYLCIALL